MRKILIVIFIIITTLSTFSATAQKFIWARPETGTVGLNGNYNNTLANSLIDDYGNIYSGAAFMDTLSATASSPFNQAIYLAKYNSIGKLVWGISDTGSGDCNLITMCKNKLGNIYILGIFEGSHTFGTVTITGDIGIFSYFVLKCDTSGNIYWARSYNNNYNNGAGNYDITLNSIACDTKDSVYIQGYNSGNYNANGIPSGTANMFISKLSPLNGYAIRTMEIIGTAFKDQNSIITDYNDDLIITGVFGNQNAAEPGLSCVFTPNDSLITDTGTFTNGYAAKYNASGTYLWSKKFGTIGSCDLKGISCDSNNNIYISDAENGTIFHEYIKKVNSTGLLLWQNECNCGINSVACNKENAYLTLTFFDSLKYSNLNIFKNGSHNIIVKLDPNSGNTVWATDPIDNDVSNICASNIGTILYKGLSTDDLNYYQNLQIGNNNLYNGGNGELYLSLISDTTFTPVNANKISGNIYNDTNLNCLKDLSEMGLSNFSVIAQPGSYFGVTDTLGNYTIKVPLGNFIVHQLLPKGHNMLDTQSCVPTGYSVNFTGSNQVSLNNDFGNQYKPCSLIRVTTSGNGYLQGNTLSSIKYTVCSFGAEAAKNMVLRIQYTGPVISPISSSIPWSSYNTLDSSLTFNLGDFPPDSCLDIIVVDTVNSSSTYRSSFPFYVRLTPINSCYPSDSVHNNANFIYKEEYYVAVPSQILSSDVIKLFPNPTMGTITLDGLQSKSSVEVFSVLGQKIFSVNSKNSQTLKIDLSQQASGVYIIAIKSNHNTVYKKATKY
jgi:hypothetical protein